jgi:hypothetical protein
MIITALLAAAQPAPPINLKCVWPHKTLVISLDENRGVANYVTSVAQSWPAVFTPDMVIVKIGTGSLATEWRISRVNLSIKEVMGRTVEQGQCELQETPKRAF